MLTRAFAAKARQYMAATGYLNQKRASTFMLTRIFAANASQNVAPIAFFGTRWIWNPMDLGLDGFGTRWIWDPIGTQWI